MRTISTVTCIFGELPGDCRGKWELPASIKQRPLFGVRATSVGGIQAGTVYPKKIRPPKASNEGQLGLFGNYHTAGVLQGLVVSSKQGSIAMAGACSGVSRRLNPVADHVATHNTWSSFFRGMLPFGDARIHCARRGGVNDHDNQAIQKL